MIPDTYAGDRRHRTLLNEYRKNLAILIRQKSMIVSKALWIFSQWSSHLMESLVTLPTTTLCMYLIQLFFVLLVIVSSIRCATHID